MGCLEIIKFVVMIVILSNQQDSRFLRDVLDTDQIMELLIEFFQRVVNGPDPFRISAGKSKFRALAGFGPE
jgi:hypothetical protein